jgi:hypothetical protein
MQPPPPQSGHTGFSKETEGQDHTPQSDRAGLLLPGLQAARDGVYFGDERGRALGAAPFGDGAAAVI